MELARCRQNRNWLVEVLVHRTGTSRRYETTSHTTKSTGLYTSFQGQATADKYIVSILQEAIGE
jgi:hypothetical protein